MIKKVKEKAKVLKKSDIVVIAAIHVAFVAAVTGNIVMLVAGYGHWAWFPAVAACVLALELYLDWIENIPSLIELRSGNEHVMFVSSILTRLTVDKVHYMG